MAIKSKAQIQAESNSTYVDNSVGGITPTSVRSLNTDWIDSIIFAEATASLTVFGATSASFAVTASNALTASFLLGSVASASFSQFAVSSSQATSASFASTASFVSGVVASASFATSASRAISAATATSASFASTSTSASFATSASRAISSLSASYAFTASSATNSANAISASFATSASRAISSATATSSSFADTSTSASYALTASFALNVPATASFAISSSFAQSASLATRNILTASAAANILTFTKGDGTTFNVSIAQSGSVQSASYADTANFANSASYALTSSGVQGINASLVNSTYYLGFVPNAEVNAISIDTDLRYNPNTGILSSNQFTGALNGNATTATTAASATSASFATNAATASLAPAYASLTGNNTLSGINTFNNAVTMSNVQINGTASIQYLNVVFQSSSIIYSSGSNQLGDAPNDTQTLWGTVNVISGPLVVTGSANFASVITGSISGNAATATSSTSASYAFTASSAISASFATSASFVNSASFASTAGTVQGINASGVDSTYYLGFVPNANPNAISIDTDLVYYPGPGILSTTQFNGALNGNANTATTASFATTAGSLSGTASYALTASGVQGVNASTVNSTYYLGFVPNASINALSIDTDLSYNPSTGIINGTITNAATASVLLGAVVSSSYAFTASSAEKAFEAVSSSYALTASYLEGAVSAFPFTGSAGISGSLDLVGRLYIPSGSLEITGSATINSGSLIMFSYKNVTPSNRSFQAMVTQSLNSTNNIISISQGTPNSGSIVISGSGNYVSLNSVQTNASYNNGATSGFFGQNAYVTILPIITGSNPNFNTTADRNSRAVPTVINSNVNATITTNDNRASETNTPVVISNSSINGTITATVDSGSLTISNTNIAGTSLVVSSSNIFGGGGGTSAQISNSIISTTGANIRLEASGARAAQINNSFIGGNTIRLLVSASAANNATIASNLIVGDNLIVTSSYYGVGFSLPIGSAFLGSYNTADGILNNPEHTRFAIGTGTGAAARRTSLSVSSSGLTTISNGLVVSGSTVAQAISSSFSGSGADIFGVVSSSLATQNLITASAAANVLTFTKGDGTTFDVTVAQSGSVVSASYADTANFANTAEFATSASLAQFAGIASAALSASFASTASFLLGSVESASYAFTASSAVNATNALTASSVSTLNQTVTITGSLNISGSISISQGDDLITHHVQAAAVNGVEIQNNSGNVVGLFGAGGSLGSTFYGQVNATAFSGSGALVYGVVSSSYAYTASSAVNATSASFAETASFFAGSVTSASFAQTSITASFATNFRNSGSYVITGSHRGNVVSQSIASSTASFDFSTGNFFTLNLTGSTLTHISASNIQAGQTVNVRITQGATTGSVSFSPAFDQVSGSAYVPTQVANAVDILTFITFDNSLIYVSNIKNLV